MGIVALQGVEVFGKVGVLDQERVVGKKLWVDVEVKTSLKKASDTDNVADALNYADIAQAIYSVLEKCFNLLESACREMAVALLKKYEGTNIRIEDIKIRINKSKPFLAGNIYAAWVEWRMSEDF